MAALHDLNAITVMSSLTSRGLTGADIDRAMRQMVGNDWKEISASLWFKRLRNQGYVLQNDRELTVSDLEALINGRLTLERLSRLKNVDSE